MKSAIAEQYARKYHEGQLRKTGSTPYIVHPENVVNFLKQMGINDDISIAIAWLHDTLEDTKLSYEEISRVFGEEVAQGVLILTRNTGRDEYKQRLAAAPANLKMIKLADTLDNVSTLDALSAEGVRRKIEDCIFYYIPEGYNLCPTIAALIGKNIFDYLSKRQA